MYQCSFPVAAWQLLHGTTLWWDTQPWMWKLSGAGMVLVPFAEGTLHPACSWRCCASTGQPFWFHNGGMKSKIGGNCHCRREVLLNRKVWVQLWDVVRNGALQLGPAVAVRQSNLWLIPLFPHAQVTAPISGALCRARAATATETFPSPLLCPPHSGWSAAQCRVPLSGTEVWCSSLWGFISQAWHPVGSAAQSNVCT